MLRPCKKEFCLADISTLRELPCFSLCDGDTVGCLVSSSENTFVRSSNIWKSSSNSLFYTHLNGTSGMKKMGESIQIISLPLGLFSQNAGYWLCQKTLGRAGVIAYLVKCPEFNPQNRQTQHHHNPDRILSDSNPRTGELKDRKISRACYSASLATSLNSVRWETPVSKDKMDRSHSGLGQQCTLSLSLLFFVQWSIYPRRERILSYTIGKGSVV